MSALRVVVGRPALTIAVLGLASWALLVAFNISYDDGGLRSVVYWIAQVLRAPFWAVEELLFLVGNGREVWGHHLMAIVLGLGLCIAVDVLIGKARASRDATTTP